MGCSVICCPTFWKRSRRLAPCVPTLDLFPLGGQNVTQATTRNPMTHIPVRKPLLCPQCTQAGSPEKEIRYTARGKQGTAACWHLSRGDVCCDCETKYGDLGRCQSHGDGAAAPLGCRTDASLGATRSCGSHTLGPMLTQLQTSVMWELRP